MKSDEKIIRIACSKCENKNGKYVCYDEEESVKCFWGLNITKNMDMFDFEENFGIMNARLESKLAEHGLLGWEPYADFHESIYGKSDYIPDYEITAEGGYRQIYRDELRDVLLKYVAEELKETYEDCSEFEEIKELYMKIKYDSDDLPLKEQALLFDQLIHLCHITGPVLDVDISRLREEFEEEIK